MPKQSSPRLSGDNKPDGNLFLELIEAAMAPATLTSKTGMKDGVLLTFSNGRTIKANRQQIRAVTTEEEMAAYVRKCAGRVQKLDGK